MNLDIQQCYKYEIKTNMYIVSIRRRKGSEGKKGERERERWKGKEG